MKRIVVWIVKVAAVVSVIFLMLVVAVFFLVQTDSVQQRLLNHATDLLSEELQTKVEIDRISVSLSDRDVRLYGLTVEDLQQRKMLQVEELGLRMKLRPLLHRRLQVTEARMRRLKGGKLPIGQVSADIAEANYKKLKFRVMTADINSDGALAEGRIVDKGKFVDLLCKFSFTNTNEMKKTKIVPGIKFHKKEKKKHAK